ncbi:MAG: pilus assembly protein PilM [Candidatus Omnitrophica bacterium]|nr:pilus assembly protein PilM [Candidatus Omnitrophota bacterium]
MGFGALNNFKEKLMSGFPQTSMIGVDIGGSTLKIIEMRMIPSCLISSYSIIDISGDNSGDRITREIAKFLADNRSKTNKAVLTFTDGSVVIKRVELAGVARDEIPNAVRWQFKGMVPYDIERACVDYKLLREIQKEDGSRAMELMVAIAPRDIIDKRTQALKAAGLEVLSINLAPFGLENILKLYDGEDASKVLTIVDIGHLRTEISIFDNKRLELVRSVPARSLDISEALTMTLAGEKGTISLTMEEAESIKRNIGVPYDKVADGTKMNSVQIMSLIRPVLERIAGEIGRSDNYYVHQYEGKKVSMVYLVGAGSRLKNLGRFLSEELSLSVKMMELPKSINVSKTELKQEDVLPLISLIGAVIGYKTRPNLLPHEYKTEKREFLQNMMLRMAAVTAGVILAISFIFMRMQVDGYKQRLKQVQFQKEIMTKIKEQQVLVGERETFLEQVRAAEVRPAPVLKELARIMPPNIILDWVRIDMVGKTMDISGIVMAPKGTEETVLTKFNQDMQKSEYFKEAQITFVQAVDDAKENKARFEINFMLE